MAERMELPEPLGTVAAVRFEHQHWLRRDRAEGELQVGYDARDRPVRVEYHWVRWFSRANAKLDDIYTGELWARRPAGDWLYLLRPQQTAYVVLRHVDVRRVLQANLALDLGD